MEQIDKKGIVAISAGGCRVCSISFDSFPALTVSLDIFRYGGGAYHKNSITLLTSFPRP